MITKKCSNCSLIKEIDNFYEKFGKTYNQCKDCLKLKSKKYRQENKEKYQEYFKEYQEKNDEKLKEYKRENYIKNKEKILERSRVYYYDNKEEINKKASDRQKNNRNRINVNNRILNKKKRKNDPLFRLINNLRTNIFLSIRRCGYNKSSRTYEILGCSYEEFKKYIEDRFLEWMSWDNYGKYNGLLNYGWDIDHIIPVSSSKTEEDIIRLNHYTNLQPLCSKINRDIKKDKLKYEI